MTQGLEYLRTKQDVRILGWVLMPEHVHLVLLPPDELHLGDAIGRFKRWTTGEILGNPGFRGPILCRQDGRSAVWERRCYDHNCRTPDVVRKAIEYCHKNPVRRGLVDHPSRWPWSSYNWYYGEGGVVLEIDGVEL